MAKRCETCGGGMPLWSRGALCSGCRAKRRELEHQVEGIITSGNVITDEQLQLLSTLSRIARLRVYSRVWRASVRDKELEQHEIATLRRLQDSFGLTNKEISFDEHLAPYLYVRAIRDGGDLPSIDFSVNGTPVALRRGEVIHYGCPCSLLEMRSVYKGYVGGSRGVSIRVMKGVTYRVGACAGHLVDRKGLVPVSRGALVLTNKRLCLHPTTATGKVVAVPLNKVLSYSCYRDGLQVNQEGRQKPLIFSMKAGAVEIMGMCLGHLLTP